MIRTQDTLSDQLGSLVGATIALAGAAALARYAVGYGFWHCYAGVWALAIVGRVVRGAERS